jgi:hypothetical protein
MPEEFEEFIGGENNADIFRRTAQAIALRDEAVLKAIWEAMPWGLKIDLPGGEDAVLKKFVEPRQKDGAWEFGFDVRDTTGAWHLEFFVKKTGWGGVPIGRMDPIELPDSRENEE